jgi:hypothetical protein
MGFNGIKSGLSSYSATDRQERLEQNGKDPSFVSVTRLAIEAMALCAHKGAVLDNGGQILFLSGKESLNVNSVTVLFSSLVLTRHFSYSEGRP